MSDLAHLKRWVGRSDERSETLTGFPSNALAATLNRDDGIYEDGSALPPLWHWLHFLELFKLEDAGYDGHAALGRFLPPVPLPRRMWAGSRLTWHAPMRIGRKLTKRSDIASVTPKSGRSGDLVFVTVRHQISDAGMLCLDEEHDIVYRAAPKPEDRVHAPPKAGQTAAFTRTISPTETLLFRYSALTFNGHRIHYDYPFCKNEGYDGLVVHGPLLATLMMDAFRRERCEARVTGFQFRAQAPVTGKVPFDVQGCHVEEGQTDLWVRREDGTEAMRGRATWEPA